MSQTPFIDSAIEAYSAHMKEQEEKQIAHDKEENLRKIVLLTDFLSEMGHDVDNSKLATPKCDVEGLSFALIPNTDDIIVSSRCRSCMKSRTSKPLQSKVDLGEFLSVGCNCYY